MVDDHKGGFWKKKINSVTNINRLRQKKKSQLSQERAIHPIKSILKNVASLGFAQLVGRFSGLIGAVYLARILGAAAYGQLSFVIAMVAYFVLIVEGGLTLYGTREIARSKRLDLVDPILSLRLILLLFTGALYSLVVFFIPKPLDLKLLLIMQGLYLFYPAFSLNFLFQAVEKMTCLAKQQIFEKIIYLVLIFLFVHSSSDLLYVPIVRFISIVISENAFQLNRLMCLTFRINLLIAAPLYIGSLVVADSLILFLFDASYQGSILPFKLLMLTFLIISMNIPFALFVLSSGRQNQYLYSVFVGAGVNLTLNFILIPIYGMAGAAIATIACEVGVFLMLHRYSTVKIDARIVLYFVKPIAAALLMGAILLLIQIHFIPTILLGVVLYPLILFGIRGFDTQNYREVMDLFKKIRTQSL
ncbi:MAG: hypothetical protein B6244_05295 [Candidatus Cloacimonetes bacterium 4572_55]|nr:MAG: hypothetical protein B6244_05295 [Candidatus Cloacimonetes bacterium 4572_55]